MSNLIELNRRPKTIICDIDGTILKHHGSLNLQYTNKPVVLEGVIEKIAEWDSKGYNIILITGRRESMRNKTHEHLEVLGIFYDQLIMGVGGGERVLINDLKPNCDKATAISINIVRNKGIKNLEV